MDTRMQEIGFNVQELLKYHRNEAICQYCKKKLNEKGLSERKIIPYTLGQDIFYLHYQIDLKSVLDECLITYMYISSVVLMDDGRLVLCLTVRHIILVCNTDGSQVDSIPVQGGPWYVTAVNNSTVAVIVDKSINCHCIEMYDINNKHILTSISVPGIHRICGITMMNNKLVVGVDDRLLIVDHQTAETIQTIKTNIKLRGIHASGDEIFFVNTFNSDDDNRLYWYSFTDDNIQTLALPSTPLSITTLQDGSLYVLCKDGFVQHVSSNGKQFKTLNGSQYQFFQNCSWIRYNSKQRKIITGNSHSGIVQIHQEK